MLEKYLIKHDKVPSVLLYDELDSIGISRGSGHGGGGEAADKVIN